MKIRKVKIILNFKDHPEKARIEIEGIYYSYEFFTMIGKELKLNEPFIIVKREDGIITVERYEKFKGVPK